MTKGPFPTHGPNPGDDDTLWVGKSLVDAEGRATLARELMDLAKQFTWAAAVVADASKVLRTDSEKMVAAQVRALESLPPDAMQ